MAAQRDHQKMLRIVGTYTQELEALDEEIFQRSPVNGGWSYSEVYFHIFDASLLTLQTIADCTAGNGKQKKTPWTSRLILFLGSLPPGQRYKAPRRLAERLKKISKKEASALIKQFLDALEQAYPKLQQARKDVKIPHPRLGDFNAFQWFRFMEIHLNHHLKQVRRLHKHF